jgi:hypothetical protein
MSLKTITPASKAFPLIYQILLTYIEPFLTLGGITMCLTTPETYLSQMTRNVLSTSLYDRRTDFVYTQLAGGWLHFAFTEVVVLRALDDVRAWRWICGAMLFSDLAYCHSCAQALGGWAVWIRVAEWTTEEWLVVVLTLPFVLARLFIVLGFGMKKIDGEKKIV